jgi:hypothetical protein
MITQLERVDASLSAARVRRQVRRNTPDAVSHRQAAARCLERGPLDVCRSEPYAKIASRLNEWRSAFALVHEAYTLKGLAEPNPLGMRVTPYQLLPTTEVLVAIDHHCVVCTASVVRDGRLGLPLEDIYADEVAARRRQGLVLAEVSCLADGQEGKRTAFSNVLELMSLCTQCATARGVDQLVIAVHPRHAPFYQKFFGFETFGGQRSYGAVLDAPAVALALDLNHLAENHPRGYERLFGKPFPADVLAYRPMPDHFRRELALNMTDMAMSNECPCRGKRHEESGASPCESCHNLCRQRALFALKGPASVAL